MFYTKFVYLCTIYVILRALAHENRQPYKLMSTIIYPSPIFGPVHSRRLGVSLGVNLQPGDGKVCTFDCVYCECGFNADFRPSTPRPSRKSVAEALEQRLSDMKERGEALDVLTFAGNGEPTGHPEFPQIISDTIAIRDKYYPGAKVSVLSNGTFVHKKGVRDALMMVDNNIQKVDTVCSEYIKLVDRPTQPSYSIEKVIDNLCLFDGHVIVQTMFMTGHTAGQSVDNTTEEYLVPWMDALRRIKPSQVMIYTIDRETPDHDLRKADKDTLDAIRDRVIEIGIPCSASY